MPITFCAKALCETFCAKVLGESFGQCFFWNHILNLGLGWAAGRQAGLGPVWAGGWAVVGCGLGEWAGLAGWATLKRNLVYSKMERLCPGRKNALSDGQQQQAISIYFFLEGLGFRV